MISLVLGISDHLAVDGAGVHHLLATLLANKVGKFGVEILKLGDVEERVHRFIEASIGVLDEEVSGVSHKEGQVSDLVVRSVFETSGERAVVAPTEVASAATEGEHPAGNEQAHRLDHNSEEPTEQDDRESGDLEGPNCDPCARLANSAKE